MRLIRLLCSATVIVMLALVASAPVVSAHPMPYQGPPPAHAAPNLTARASIAIDLTSGLQLHGHEADTRVSPASTMKIVTALVAREILDPAETITIVESDLYLGEEYSQMGLIAGDVASVESLFYGVLLSSGADASLALARVAGQRLDPSTNDPVGRFVQEMNAWSQAHRMHNSNFTNPVGVEEDDHYSSARDLVRATEAMLADWLLFQVTSTPEVIVTVGGPNSRELYLYNTNELVLTGEGIGGKTGTHDIAGQCLINVTRRGDHTIVTVVMGSEDRFGDTRHLLESIGERYRFVILGSGSSLPGLAGEVEAHGLVFPVRSTVVMTPEQLNQLDYELQLTDNRSPGGRAGVVVFRIGDREILKLPVYATG